MKEGERRFETEEKTDRLNSMMYELDALGVETKRALYNLNGKRELYRDLLLVFYDMATETPILQDFTEDAYDFVAGQVHAMKGAAGNLAITPLYQYYDRILILLRNGEGARAKEMLAEMEPVKNRILDCIGKLR